MRQDLTDFDPTVCSQVACGVGAVRFHRHISLLVLISLVLPVAYPQIVTAESLESQAADVTPLPTEETRPSHTPRVKLGTRIHGAYQVAEEAPTHELSLRRARLVLDMAPLPWLDAQIDLDAADAPPLKDAWVRSQVATWLQVTVGQLKKPFGRLLTMSSAQLPVWRRGMVCSFFGSGGDVTADSATAALGFGGRDRGVMLSGDLGEVRYVAGLFNGSGTGPELDSGKDANLRLTYARGKAIQLGLSGAMQYRNHPDSILRRKDRWAAGIDARLRLWHLDILVEGFWARDARTAHGPQPVGALLLGSMHLKIDDSLRLQPLVKAEILDQDILHNHDHALSQTIGLNFHFGKMLRLMLQGEQILPAARLATATERRAVIVLALDQSLVLVE